MNKRCAILWSQLIAWILLGSVFQLGFALTPAQKTESFWQKLLRVTGISATPRNQRGEEDAKPGHIWVANFQNQTRFQIPTTDGGYRSPIFLRDPGTVLALQGENVISVSVADGTTKILYPIKGIFKLVGVSIDEPDQVLVLSDEDRDSCPTVGLLSLTSGQVTPLPHGSSEEDQRLINHLLSWNRVYDGGDTRLDTKKHDDNTWLDVFFKVKNKDWVNVSKCQNVNCTQPSLSDDRQRMVFIKQT